MWRIYLTQAWLMLLCALALPWLVITFRRPGNTGLFMYFYAVVAQRLSGIRIQLAGTGNILREPAIYVLNHQSSLDGMPLGMLRIPRLAIIGKKEVALIPFIGWAFWLAGNVLIDRADGKKARGQLDAGVAAIKSRRVSIAIFPEGTRSKEEGFLPFKRGAFQMAIEAGVPVVPVVIESLKRVINPAAKKYGGLLRVHVLAPLQTAGLTPKDSPALASKVQNLMQAEFDSLQV
ncbi:MAG: lysophospholipid acyltransferase family protein [Spirochaetota bacterium]